MMQTHGRGIEVERGRGGRGAGERWTHGRGKGEARGGRPHFMFNDAWQGRDGDADNRDRGERWNEDEEAGGAGGRGTFVSLSLYIYIYIEREREREREREISSSPLRSPSCFHWPVMLVVLCAPAPPDLHRVCLQLSLSLSTSLPICPTFLTRMFRLQF